MGASFNLIQAMAQGFRRIVLLLIKPQEAWTRIAQAPIGLKPLLFGHVLPLAAIMPVCTMIGMVLANVQIIQQQMVHYTIEMVVNYVFAVLAVYVVAYLTNLLIPLFGGEKSYNNAVRLVAYTATAIWLPGVFWLFPDFGKLAFVLSFYCLYLGYLGLKILMKCPEGKALGLVIIMFVMAIGLGIVTQSFKDMVFDSEQYEPHAGPFVMPAQETP
jgi:hypothetical protein